MNIADYGQTNANARGAGHPKLLRSIIPPQVSCSAASPRKGSSRALSSPPSTPSRKSQQAERGRDCQPAGMFVTASSQVLCWLTLGARLSILTTRTVPVKGQVGDRLSRTQQPPPSFEGTRGTYSSCLGRSTAAVCTDFPIPCEVIIYGAGSELIGLTAQDGNTNWLVISLD
jgi:hypothetical protein